MTTPASAASGSSGRSPAPCVTKPAMTASPDEPDANATRRRPPDVLPHDEAADEPDRDRLEPEHQRRQRAADAGHGVGQQPRLQPEADRPEHGDAAG